LPPGHASGNVDPVPLQMYAIGQEVEMPPKTLYEPAATEPVLAVLEQTEPAGQAVKEVGDEQ